MPISTPRWLGACAAVDEDDGIVREANVGRTTAAALGGLGLPLIGS